MYNYFQQGLPAKRRQVHHVQRGGFPKIFDLIWTNRNPKKKMMIKSRIGANIHSLRRIMIACDCWKELSSKEV